jgi:steroid delta-isomerase-like uncharacterized protein
MDIPQIVRRYVEAWSARDIDGYLATFGADGTYSDPNLPEPTLAHGLKEHFAGYLAGFPDLSHETVALDAISDDVSVWRFIIRGTNTASYHGVPPTGRRVVVPGCEFIEVRGDRVHRVQGYIDRLTILNQLGLVTPNQRVSQQ